MRRFVLLACTLLAACGRGSSSSNPAGTAATELTTQLAQSGVQCAPSPKPDKVAACATAKANDPCTVPHGEETFHGVCRLSPDGKTLACMPPTAEVPPPIQACQTLPLDHACSFPDDGRTVNGFCRQLPEKNVLICIPQPSKPEAPPPLVQACSGSGQKAGSSCSATIDGKTFDGVCTQLPEGGPLVCLPPPPPPVAVCVGKQEDQACSFTVGEKTVTGTCRELDDDDDGPLACLPAPPPPFPPDLVHACDGKSANADCSVQREGKTLSGKCHQLPDGGPLICLPQPPAPPQEAIDACAHHLEDQSCSFAFKGETVNGACEPLPDAASTLVCAPECRER